ncbi:MAG: ornithine cyclodeaminase family protein [Ilumatobacteraceae bacterium]
MNIPHLTDEQVESLVDYESARSVLKDAFIAWGSGDAASSLRIRTAAGGLLVSSMVAVLPPYSGGKIYSTKDGVFRFVNMLFGSDGLPLCTLDGDYITRVRTPALVDLAVDLLRPPLVTRVAVIGCGRQGAALARMLLRGLPDLEEIVLCDAFDVPAEALAVEARNSGIAAHVEKDPRRAVEGAQIVVTATASKQPLFLSQDVGDNVLICAVGATKPEMCEIDPFLLARVGMVVCDDVIGSKIECGDLLRAAEAGTFSWADAIEFRELLCRPVSVREPLAKPVLFETQGVALQDLAVAALAWERHSRLS